MKRSNSQEALPVRESDLEGEPVIGKVDEIISLLLSIQNKPVGTLVNLKIDQIEWLI
jgi:hypothetical protein